MRWASAVALVVAIGCEASTSDECPAWTRADDGRCVLRTWTQPDVVSAPGAREVQIAVGVAGDAIVAWSDPEVGSLEIVERSAAAWSPIAFARDTGVALEPAVAIGPMSEAILAWKQQRADGEIHIATRDPGGAWHDVDERFSWVETAYEPRVGFADDGEAFVVWNQWTGTNFGVAVAVRETIADAFVRPRDANDLLSAPVNYANGPRIAIEGDGDALLAWYQAPADDLMVYVSERREDGSFTKPSAGAFVSPVGGPVDSHVEANAMPALHPSGVAAVAWTQRQRGEWDIAVYLAVRDAAGTWTRPASRDDSLSEPGAFARCPQLAFTPEGSIVVTWYETRDGATDVFVWQGEARDGGVTRRLSSDGVDAVHPALVVDADGGAMIAWAQNTADAPDTWRVVATRYLPADDRWLEVEPISTPQAGLAPTPQLGVAKDTGEVIAAWAQGGVNDARVHVATLP